MTMSGRRLILPLLLIPSAAKAGALSPVGTASVGPLAVLLAGLALLAVAVLLATGRIGWRWAAIAVVAGSALVGGDALLDGAQTAVAVSL
jgi:hypothetical protein